MSIENNFKNNIKNNFFIYLMNTVQFSISKKNLVCNDVIESLKKCKINASVTNNKSIICNTKKCWIEDGCRIIASDMEVSKIKNLWNYLKFEHKLNCCHIKVERDYQGCIKDFLRESECKN